MTDEPISTSTDQRSRGRYVSALRSRDLRTLLVSFFVDVSASWAYTIVLVAYVFERTHSAGWVTALVTTRLVVAMVTGVYGGLLADRFDRRRVLIVSALVAAAITVGIAVIVGVDAPLWLLLVASGALSAANTPVRPASGALTPEVVPESDLIAANSMFALLESVTVVAGPAIGGLLLLTGDPVYGVLINTASFLIAAGLYTSLRVRSHGSAKRGGNAFAQWFAGMSSLVSHRRAFVLSLFLVLDSGAIGAANVLMPALAEHLHGGTTGYSLLIVANALGGVVVAGLADKLAGSRRVALIIIVAMYLECVPLWVCVFVGSVPPALVLQLFSGIGMVIVDVLGFTALQRDLPRDLLGRVLATVNMLMLACTILATTLGSFVYAHFGLGWALGVIGFVFPTIGLLGLPMLRGVDAEASHTADRLAARIAVLDSVDLFIGASRGLLERLADSAEEFTLPAGERIIAQGDQPDALWILAEGTLTSSAVGRDGMNLTLPDVVAPGYVGELGLMNRAVRSASVVTAVECRLVRIPGDEFIAALEAAQASPVMLRQASVRTVRTSPPQFAGQHAGQPEVQP